jgi:hypothetical protein
MTDVRLMDARKAQRAGLLDPNVAMAQWMRKALVAATPMDMNAPITFDDFLHGREDALRHVDRVEFIVAMFLRGVEAP